MDAMTMSGEAPIHSPVQQEFAGMPQPLYCASPSRLLAWVDCPRRYRMQYLDRPRPLARPTRAHTSVGVTTHNALREWWQLPWAERTPDAGAQLVAESWIDSGFRDAAQSARWRDRAGSAVARYLTGISGGWTPRAVERTVALKTSTVSVTGRIDRLDERGSEVVVVDYKTGRVPSSRDEARTSLALALYAVAAARTFARSCSRVELHHVPTGVVVGHDHTPESLQRKLAEAESIAADLRVADADYRESGADSTRFAPRPTALCTWCDFRAHCPEGQQMGPEKSSWAGLAGDV